MIHAETCRMARLLAPALVLVALGLGMVAWAVVGMVVDWRRGR